MELINDIQIEVTEIIIRKNSLLNRRDIFHFKRLVFMADIKGISEENYLVENNYSKCSAIYVKDEGWIKVKESYLELYNLHRDWWKEASKDIIDSESV